MKGTVLNRGNKVLSSFLRSHSVVSRVLIILFFITSSFGVYSQTRTPSFYMQPTGTLYGNGFGFTSAFFGKKRCMYVYEPGVFKDASSNGPKEGLITTLYIKASSAPFISAFKGLRIGLAQDTITRLQKGKWYSGSIKEHFLEDISFTALKSGDWMMMTLEEPFEYDPTQSLIVSISNSSGHRKFEVAHAATPFISRTYGGTGSPTGSDTLRPVIGFNIQPRADYDIGILSVDSVTSPCGGATRVSATIANYGRKPISKFTVAWTFKGKLQKTLTVNQALDTIGGKGTFKHQVYLGQAEVLSGEDIVVYCSKPDGKNDGIVKNDSLINTYKNALSGGYRVIYKGAPFKDFDEVNQALETMPVCGGVQFHIRKNPYNDQFVFNEIKGLSASNTVEFISQHPDSVFFRHSAKSSTLTTLNLDGAKWMTFRNITIESRDTTYGWGVRLADGASHITFKNCRVVLDSTTASVSSGELFGVVVSGSNTSQNAPTNGVDHILFDSCEFIGGSSNIIVTGTGDSTNYLKDWRFNNCKFRKAHKTGIDAKYIDSLTVENCSIEGIRDSIFRRAINLENVANINLSKNRWVGQVILSNINTKRFYKGSHSVIANNLFSGSNQSNTIHLNLVRQTDILHNSVYGYSGRLVNTQEVKSLSILNNNFYYRGSGTCIYTDDRSQWEYCDYNNYYVNTPGAALWKVRSLKLGKTFSVKAADSIQYVQPSLFNKPSHKNYWSQDPGFVDTVFFKPSSKFLAMYGLNVGVLDDISHNQRCTLYTQIGPYESDSAFVNKKADFNSRLDTLWQNAPMVFQSNSQSTVRSKWYVNGKFVSDSVHLLYTPTRIGTDTIKLWIQNCAGTDSITKLFTVWLSLKAPLVNFYVSDSVVFANRSVVLLDSTLNGPTIWSYRITDILGNRIGFDKKLNKWVKLYEYMRGDSTSQFPEVRFRWKGTYQIKLLAGNVMGKDSLVKSIGVRSGYSLPIASFKASDTVVFTNQTIGLRNTSQNIPTEWRFEVADSKGQKAIYDPNAKTWVGTYYWVNLDSTAKSPSLWFNYPGYYTVKLVVSNPEGADSIVKTSYVKVLLAATVCDFDDSTGAAFGILYDSGGPTTKYAWSQSCDYTISSCLGKLKLNLDDFDLGDDDYLKIYEGIDASGTPLWDAKTYPNGMEGTSFHSSVVKQWTVNSGAVYIQFVSDPSRATLGRGFALKWEFDSTGFRQATADFQIQPKGCVNVPLDLTNTSTGAYKSFAWDIYNDGKIDAKTRHFTSIISKTGNQYVALLVHSYCWATDTLIKPIFITKPSQKPKPSFMANDTVTMVGDTIRLMAAVDVCTDFSEWFIYPNDYKLVKNNALVSDTVSVIFNRPGLYSVFLRQKNAVGEDTLLKVNYLRLYCKPFVNQKVNGLGITRVVLNDIDHSSVGGVKKYTDFTSESTDVLRGRNYLLELEQKNTIAIYRRAWIDWDGDGRFNDSTELVLINGPSNAAKASETITVPLSAHLGQTRMRVGTGKSAFKVSCGPIAQGEYKDYTVNIGKRDTAKPNISLLGRLVDTIPVFTSWSEPGFLAVDVHDGNVADSVTVNGRVDTARIGTYDIIYTVSDIDNNTFSITRKVVVQDVTAPQISLVGNDSIYLYLNGAYVEQSVLINDDYYQGLQAVISGKVDTTRGGVYPLEYCVSDSSGNGPVCVKRWVFVQDTVMPSLQLIGASTITIEQCSDYDDAGYSASDNDTVLVAEEGTWKGSTDSRGTFNLKYVATDGSGNSVFVERMITVVDRIPSQAILIGSSIDTVPRWSDYQDPGIAIDFSCKDSLETKIVIGGSFVNTQSAGTYSLEYTVIDSSGNQSNKVVRFIMVEDDSGLDGVVQVEYTVYPNPSQGAFTIGYSAQKGRQAQLRVYAGDGRMVYHQQNAYLSRNRSLALDLSHLESGMYYLSIADEHGEMMTKLVISK